MLSGKGGVGKSSTTVQLALTLAGRNGGTHVGILDVDLTGPNIPLLLDVESHKIVQTPTGWEPVIAVPESSTIATSEGSSGSRGSTPYGRVSCISLAFLLPAKGTSVVWRGPKKTAMVRQLLGEVSWGDIEYLLIDTPPGTSDEHISLVETLMSEDVGTEVVVGAVLVTTPQAVATADVRKEMSFCDKVGLRVFGVIENMSGFRCPCCGVITEVFSSGGGERLASEVGVEFFGKVPLDGSFVGMIEKRQSRTREGVRGTEGVSVDADRDGDRDDEGLMERYSKCGLAPVYREIVGKLVDSVEIMRREREVVRVAELKVEVR